MNCLQKKSLNILCFIFLLLLSACQMSNLTSSMEVPKTETTMMSPNQTPSQTSSLYKTSTSEPTPSLTPSATATLTPTVRWDDRALGGTTFPQIREQISQQNVDNVRELAVWGMGRVNDLVLSPDGLILAVGTNIGVYLYDSLNYDLIARLPTHGPVLTIAFSIEKWWIALGETGGVIEIFDYVELTPVVSLRQPHTQANDLTEMSLSFSDEGNQITSVIKTPENIYIHGWRTSDWQASTSFSLENSLTAYFNPDINLLGIFDEGQLRLQSLSHADEYQIVSLTASVSENFWSEFSTFEPQPAPSRDGNFILMNTGKTIFHWEIQEDQVTYRLDDYPSQMPNPCSTAPDTCHNVKGTFSWDCSDAANITPIALIALTPDDVMMLISRNDGFSEFRRASDGILAWEIRQTFTKVTFSPGSEFFFGLRPDGVIEKRGTLDGKLLSYLNFHPDQLFDLAFSPDESVLAAGFDNSLIQIYDPYDGELLGVLNGNARSLAFSPDGELLAGGLTDGTVRIYQLNSGRYYDIAPGHLAAVTDLQFLSDGERLLTVSEDCTLSLWDIKDRYRLENIIPGDKNPFQIKQVETPSTGLQKFISGLINGVFLFDAANQIELRELSDSSFSDLALSPNGDFLAAAGVAGSFVADLRTTSFTITNMPSLEAYAVTFTQDGRILAIVTHQALEFWSAENGKLLSSLTLYEEDVPGGIPAVIEMASDGSMIALGTQDGLIHIFGLQ
jgi:WD40 repeat protein